MTLHPAGQAAAAVTRRTGGPLPHLLTRSPEPDCSETGVVVFFPDPHTLTDICLSTVQHPLVPGLSSPAEGQWPKTGAIERTTRYKDMNNLTEQNIDCSIAITNDDFHTNNTGNIVTLDMKILYLCYKV
jgi:hypothetical protein